MKLLLDIKLKTIIAVVLFFGSFATNAQTFCESALPPEACAINNFSFSYTQLTNPGDIQFNFPYIIGSTAPNGLKIDDISWNFGDINNSVTQATLTHNPIHNYSPINVCGTDVYTVLVCVLFENGTSCLVTQTIIVSNPSQSNTATIVATPTGNCGEYLFSYTVANSITSPKWNFGDGTFDYTGQQTISHTYPTNGTYTITLGGQGIDPCMVATTVIVNSLPLVNFSYNLEEGAPGTECNNIVDFSISNYNSANIYVWNFEGNLQSAIGANTQYSFNVLGPHVVYLTIYDANGCTQTTSKYVVVGGVPASFTASDVCVGDQLQISGLAYGGDSYSWSLVEGSTTFPLNGLYPYHVFTQSGTHNLSLTVTSQNGNCTDVVNGSVTVLDLPDASFTYQAVSCGDIAISLTNPGTFTDYVINYGHGPLVTGTATSNNFSGTDNLHTYTNNGVYTVTVTLNNGVCSNTFTQTVAITNLPIVSITTPNIYLCPNGSVLLNSTITGVTGSGTITYSWEETANPGNTLGTGSQFNATAPGFYQLIVTYNGCMITSTQTIEVKSLNDPTGTIANVMNVSCLGAQDGSAEITVTAALFNDGCLINGTLLTTANTTFSGGFYTYLLSGLITGNNYVTISNALNTNCSNVFTIPVGNDGPVINITSITSSNCGNNNGSISATTTLGSLALYTLVNYPAGPALGNMNNLGAGDYVLVATNGGCVVTQTVNVPSKTFSLSLLNTSFLVCVPGGTIDIEIDDLGIGANLAWEKFDGAIWQAITVGSGSGTPQTSTSVLYNVVDGVGDYRVLGSLNGCNYTLPFTLTPTFLQVSLAKTGGYCTGSNAIVSSQVVGGDANYTPTWLTGGTGSFNTAAPNGNNFDITGLVGSVDVILNVVDGQGCMGTKTITIVPLTGAIDMAACGTTTPYNAYDPNDLVLDGNGDIDYQASTNVQVYTASVVSGCDVEVCATEGNPATSNYAFEWYLPNQTVNTQKGIIFTVNGTNSYGPIGLSYNDPFNNNTLTTFNLPVGVPIPSFTPAASPASPRQFTDNNYPQYPYFETDGTNVYFALNSSGIPYNVTVIAPQVQSTLVHGHMGVTQASYFLSGTNIYEVYVSDEYGCKNGPYAIELTINTATGYPGFDFVWAKPGNDNHEPEPIVEDVNLKDNMQEAANELLSAAAACMESQAQEMVAEFQKCFDISTFRDDFTLKYDVNEYHYTIYYYDRAGQLTKTIPPAGVDLLNTTEIANLITFRDNATAPASNIYRPNHNMETKYKYNGLGQLIQQQTPDGGTTKFIYDGLNRLRFSQNAEQLASNPAAYSYTKYDALGRIIEVGESIDFGNLNFNDVTLPANVLQADASSFPQNDYNIPSAPIIYNTEVTHTVYSNPKATISYYGLPQKYLQNRVSYVFNDDDGNLNTTGDQNATYYSYDAHGNVTWLVQEIEGFGQNFVKYEYDLISGNVLQVSYNEKREDRFFHRYSYDAENRLEVVETSRDGLLWDEDANYAYYEHGPLKRTVLGEDHVQGLDYLYTIHGWLKSINTPSLSSAGTVGTPWIDQDGELLISTQNTEVAQDRFGMSLGYYNGDYDNVNTFHNNANSQLNGSPLYAANGNAGNDLFNGNISHWTHSQLLNNTGVNVVEARGSIYQYDVLNRIKASKNQQQTNTSTPAWNAVNNDYETNYSYDANGNISTLNRFNNGGVHMDDLDYLYYKYNTSTGLYAGTYNPLLTPKSVYDAQFGPNEEPSNRLYSVSDQNNIGQLGELIGTHVYQYDEIGNLIQEDGSELMDQDNNNVLEPHPVTTNIAWTVYGKVKTVTKQILDLDLSTNYQQSLIDFSYDASGNRISKKVKDYTWVSGVYQLDKTTITYYVRDAQGNTLSVYADVDDVLNPAHTLELIEQPIYGSDRLGQNSKKVLLASVAPGNPILPLGTGIENISEYQNWVVSANGKLSAGLNDVCNTKIDLINFNQNNVYGATAQNEFLGIARNGVAVAENTDGDLQFYTVLTKKYLGNKDACLVYDANGNLMKGTEMITDINTESKPIIVNLTGSNKYALITLNSNNQPTYHVVDMDALGYGSSANAGEVKTSQIALPLSANTTASYGLHFTGYEDHVNGKSIVYATRFIAGNTEIVAYEFVGNNAPPNEYILYSLNSCADTKQGELQISKNGNKLLWYHHDEYVSGFDHRVADVYEIELDATKLATTGNIQVISISDAGNYGNGNVEGDHNATDLYYAQRGVYQEVKTANPAESSDKNVWKYEPLSSLNLSNITPGNPTMSYLFSEIKRGPDGKYYMPNMGEQAAQVQTWDGINNSTDVITAGSNYTLTGSVPTQVYKTFASNSVGGVVVRNVGNKQYELKDHLGNVKVVISDEKLHNNGTNVGNDLTSIDANDYFSPHVLSFSDYYPFGSALPTRTFNSSEYRYGFNGKEKDNDMGNAEGAVYDYGFRIYDARIAKFASVDPLRSEYPYWSPYHFSGLNPIKYVDLDGKEPTDPQLYWKPLPAFEIKMEGHNREDVSYYSTVGIHSDHAYFQGPTEMKIAQTYYAGQPTRTFYWDQGIKGWIEFDPHGMGLSADEATTFAMYSIGATGAIVGGLVIAGEVGWSVIWNEVKEEAAETIIEEVSGVNLSVVKGAKNLVEEGVERLAKKKVTDVASDVVKEKGTIYRVAGENTPTGKPYIGSADDLAKRNKTATDGRDRSNAETIGEYNIGDKVGRKKAEQQGIDAEFIKQGGRPGQKVKEVLDNKRNEIAPKNRAKYGLGKK